MSILLHTRVWLLCHRPHRTRLLKEIAIRKGKRDGSETGRRETPSHTAGDKWATNEITTTSTAHGRHDSPETLVNLDKSAPSTPEQTSTPKAMHGVSAKVEAIASKKAPDTGRTNEVTDSTSTSTACTFYEPVVPPTMEPTSLAQDCVSTARVEGDNLDGSCRGRDAGEGTGDLPMGGKVAGSRRIGGDIPSRAGRAGFQAQASDEFHGIGTMTPFAQTHGESTKQSWTTPRLKGTLQMCGVRTADVKLALVGRDPFLQVKACDQLRRINVTAGAGENIDCEVSAVGLALLCLRSSTRVAYNRVVHPETFLFGIPPLEQRLMHGLCVLRDHC